MKISAVVATGPHHAFSRRELETADIRSDELVVAISAVGVCHTDIAARDGSYGLPYPVVLGHEGSGVVVEVGSAVASLAEGDHVALSFNSCGACTSCRGGRPAYCRDFTAQNYIGTRPDGSHPLTSSDGEVYGHFFGQSSFASHAVANERNVVKVDRDLDVSILGPLGCGLQTGAGAVMQSMACAPGSSLLVLGGGSVGLAAVMAARIQGCATVIAAEPHQSRRQIALDIGATHAIDPSERDISEAALAVAPDGVDYVFDTTGNVEVIQSGLRAVSANAMLGMVGVPADFSENLPLNIVSTMQTGLTVKGIVEGDSDPGHFIPALLRHYRAGEFPFDKLITKYSLTDINKAVQAQHDGDVVKAVLIPES